MGPMCGHAAMGFYLAKRSPRRASTLSHFTSAEGRAVYLRREFAAARFLTLTWRDYDGGLRVPKEVIVNGNRPVEALKRGRREFLKAGGAVTAALLAPSALVADAPKALPSLPSNPVTPTAMPTRNLGKTGYKVGIFSLGGQASLEKANNFDIAVPIIERALDLGVNYIDTSSIYGGPERWSEQYVGKVMAKRRNEAFLATKTKERTRDASMRMIEKSLQLLHTDHVDLWQLHDIGTMYDIDQVFAKGGAMEALARDEGAEGGALLGPHRPLPARGADGRHQALSVRHHLDGDERGRPASLQLQRGAAAAGS